MVERDMSNGRSLLLLNGRIHTMDEENPFAEAVLIESGKVLRVGSNSELSCADVSERFDLQGVSTLPGFVDSHVHLLSYGLSLEEVDLTEAQSIDDVLHMISKATVRRGVVIASQLDPDSLKESRYPTRAELDAVFEEEAVFVKRRDEHSSVLNGAAFELIALPPNTAGIEIDSSTGKPTGVLRLQANQIALEMFHGMISEDEMKRAYVSACESAIKKGVTTVHSLVGADENPTRRDCEVLVSILDELPVRVIPYYQTRDVDKVLRLGLERIGGCILVDGSIGSRTAAFSKDYCDDPGNSGSLYLKDEELLSFFELSSRSGLQVAVHAIGDRAVEQAINCYETVLEKPGIKDQRHRIEHAEYVREEQLERIGECGICLGMQPAFEGFWGQPGGMYEKRLGKERAGRLNSLAIALKRGIFVAGGSDAPITPVDPMYGIHWAVNHPTQESRLTVEEAIRLFTLAGAHIAHRDSEFGAIRPGYSGDLVGLSSDPFSVAADELKDIGVVLVLQRGRIVVSKLPSPKQWDARRGAGYA